MRRLRAPLDETRDRETMPDRVATWVPASLMVWVVAFCVGEFIDWGIPAINSLITSIVLYCLASLLGWVHPSSWEKTGADGADRVEVSPETSPDAV